MADYQVHRSNDSKVAIPQIQDPMNTVMTNQKQSHQLSVPACIVFNNDENGVNKNMGEILSEKMV